MCLVFWNPFTYMINNKDTEEQDLENIFPLIHTAIPEMKEIQSEQRNYYMTFLRVLFILSCFTLSTLNLSLAFDLSVFEQYHTLRSSSNRSHKRDIPLRCRNEKLLYFKITLPATHRHQFKIDVKERSH